MSLPETTDERTPAVTVDTETAVAEQDQTPEAKFAADLRAMADAVEADDRTADLVNEHWMKGNVQVSRIWPECSRVEAMVQAILTIHRMSITTPQFSSHYCVTGGSDRTQLAVLYIDVALPGLTINLWDYLPGMATFRGTELVLDEQIEEAM